MNKLLYRLHKHAIELQQRLYGNDESIEFNKNVVIFMKSKLLATVKSNVRTIQLHMYLIF